MTFRNFRILIVKLLVIINLLCLLVMPVFAGTYHSGELPYPERTVRVGFWLGMSNNEILTPSVIDWIGKRASFVVINGTKNGCHVYFDYENRIAEFKRKFPDLPVLLYDWYHKSHRTNRIGGLKHDSVLNNPDWQIKNTQGEIAKGQRNDHRWMDITNHEYQDFMVAQTVDNVGYFGTDGIVFDLFHATIDRGHGRRIIERYQNGQALANRWQSSAMTFLTRMNRALPSEKYLLYNGLWPMKEGLLESQARLLPYADGSSIEYFGCFVNEPKSEREKKNEFKEYVLDILDLMEGNPSKLFPVFARSRRNVYLGYKEDYAIQRYGLAAYLLGMTPLSTFKYHSHFQTKHLRHGRTYGLSYYEDYDLDLGVPIGKRIRRDGLWVRMFTKGMVAIAPSANGDKALTLYKTYYSPEGRKLVGEQTIPEGRALIAMTYRRPSPPKEIWIDRFEEKKPGEWRFPVNDNDTKVIKEGNNSFLRIRLSPNAFQPYHERRIQPIRSLSKYGILAFRFRTTDKRGAILLRLEVNDLSLEPDIDSQSTRHVFRQNDKRRCYVVMVIKPDQGTFQYEKWDRDIPYGNLKPLRTYYYPCGTLKYNANGEWASIQLDISKALSKVAPHLVYFRIPTIRIIGEGDIDEIVIRR